MSETRKLAAILVADIVGYSRLASADEERTLARVRGLRSDLIDPAIAAPPDSLDASESRLFRHFKRRLFQRYRRSPPVHRTDLERHVWTAPRRQGFG